MNNNFLYITILIAFLLIFFVLLVCYKKTWLHCAAIFISVLIIVLILMGYLLSKIYKNNLPSLIKNFFLSKQPVIFLGSVGAVLSLAIGLFLDQSCCQLVAIFLLSLFAISLLSYFLFPSLLITIIPQKNDQETGSNTKEQFIRLLIDGRNFNYSFNELPIQQKIILWKKGKYNIAVCKYAPKNRTEETIIKEVDVWSKHAHAFEIKVKV